MTGSKGLPKHCRKNQETAALQVSTKYIFNTCIFLEGCWLKMAASYNHVFCLRMFEGLERAHQPSINKDP